MAPSSQREMAARGVIASQLWTVFFDRTAIERFRIPADDYAIWDTSGDAGFSELIFRVNDAKYKVGECIRSPTKRCGSFHHRLTIYPQGIEKKGLDVFLERISTDGVSDGEVFPHVAFEISVINQRDEQKTITWFDLKSFGKNQDSGWRNLLGGVRKSDREDFVDGSGNIFIDTYEYIFYPAVKLFKYLLVIPPCSLSLMETLFTLTPTQRLVVGTGGCEEVKIEGVSDFEKGEVIRLRPMWMNNHRIQFDCALLGYDAMSHPQVAAYPAGHLGHPHGREALAVYVHLLARKDAEAQRPLKLKLTVVNHKRLTDSMRWVGTLPLTDAGDDNWGPNLLMSVREMRDEHLGWLDENGALVLRLSATPADEGRDPLSLTNQQGLPLPSKPTKRTLVGSGEASEASPKKMKSDS
ncbi:hypothetical protein FOZ61_007824 [Perkinsus olseni]|uniref:Uncharacterized protein n=1 Tax=Perkinsus olseni TaxID=32597 RepID=A0A7J6L771_PEROL|nr:hypothetical protein FOZ61_007824 [Perkinsus olseni]KAF4658165.1 hypothetical protein FOL46_007071 [Perkinsus olseni]